MKVFKKTIILSSLVLLLTFNISLIAFCKNYMSVSAHSVQLDVTYDECVPQPYVNSTNIGDGENEKWYEFIRNNQVRHLTHSTTGPTEVQLYVSPTSFNGTISWSYISDQEFRELIQTSVVNSIKKWNNIYYYQQTNNVIEKKKLINIIDGTSLNHNLTIYPEINLDGIANATTMNENDYEEIDDGSLIEHRHYNAYGIKIDLQDLINIKNGNNSYSYLNLFYERTGAHEFGHILGLKDIDSMEHGNDTTQYHHEELLMGYSVEYLNMQKNITYKDLVGAVITRGYHTDNDHMWIFDANSSGTFNKKLICSICNGVRFVTLAELFFYNYVTFKACNDNHSLSSGNMMAVASYNNYDYYKCKYCRYVAPYEDIVAQNYTKTYYDGTQHTVTNQVTGLGYSFYENHDYHDHYQNYSQLQHKSYCECGNYVLAYHAVRMDQTFTMHGHTYGYCIDCGALVDVNTGIIIDPGLNSIEYDMVTDNGSYILPNGIYIIVEEDMEAYLEGTLEFHPNNQVSE